MAITIEEVKKLAALSRINLEHEELCSMQNDMTAILQYVEEINKAPQIDSSFTVSDRKNVWREDIDVNETGKYTERLLANAPSREGNYVKVKKIL